MWNLKQKNEKQKTNRIHRDSRSVVAKEPDVGNVYIHLITRRIQTCSYYIGWVSSGDVMYSRVIIVNKTGHCILESHEESCSLKFSPHTRTKGNCEVMGVLTNLIVVIILQHMHNPNHHAYTIKLHKVIWQLHLSKAEERQRHYSSKRRR